MSKELIKQENTVTLDRIRIASYKYEDNKYNGTQWVEYWCVLGTLSNPIDESSFVQYADPVTGKEVYLYVKIENGNHPLQSGTMLGKCDLCQKWVAKINGVCELCGRGDIIPYDGYTRLMNEKLSNKEHMESIKELAYSFLSKEEVPDISTWQNRKILEIK